MTVATKAQNTPELPSGWDDSQARCYAETIEVSDYVERVAPVLGAHWDDFLDIGAGSGALGARLVCDGGLWKAVEPQPAMQALLGQQRSLLSARRARLELHACTWQALPVGVRARQLLAANLAATHHEAGTFFDAMRACWQDTMQWVVAAQKGPSTFCLAGFLPPELHCSDTRPAFKRTLDQLGPHRAPDDIRFTEWHCRYVFADLQAAQGHFLNRLGLKPGTAQAVEIRRYVAQHAVTTTAGVEVGCAKRSAVLSWHAH